MNFFRNPEIRRSLYLHIAATLLFTMAGYFFGYFFIAPDSLHNSFWGIACALAVFSICLVFTCMYLFPTYFRYRRICRLSRDLDRVLHGADTLSFSDYEEGELSILKIEIDKMLLRLREQRDALRQDKLALASSMADISHQIRTPLTSIHLVLSLLSDPDLSPERRMALVRQLSLLISRIDWLIEALLKLSRLDAGTVELKPELISVSRLINAAALPLEIPMELREQQFLFSEKKATDRDMPMTVLCDFSWTVEAIANILKNCMEHTPAGGQITVTASCNTIFTELVIEDNGPGFSKEDLPHLFERFYKGKNSGEQSIGIGLALSRMILARENATIKAENRPEGGARFIIRFVTVQS